MYEKIKRSDEDFIAIGSVEDDRLIKRMNKKDSSKGEEIKQESKEEVKEEDKGEENTRKRKHGTRKKMKSRKRRFKQDTSQDDPSDIEKENDELRLCLTIAPDEDKEVDYEILDKKYPIIDWKTENLGTKPQFDESKRSEEINMNVVTRSNGQKRCFSTLIRVLSVFDREDLDAIYKLVMDIYQDKIPEGFDKVLWGDLIVMFNPDEQDEFWNSQHEWKVVSWKLHSSSGVHTLMTDEGLVVHMLIEKKYPLKKEILMQMLKLKLESEEESTMALELIRFIKKSWLVQDQTVLGKDYSNLLIADSLLKTIWFINAPCYDNEALASPNTNDEELSIPEQTATGKGTSNPLMAAKKRRGRRVSITISMSDDEEQQKNKRKKKLHDRPSKTAKSKVHIGSGLPPVSEKTLNEKNNVKALSYFIDDMEFVMKSAKVDNISNIDMVFLPVLLAKCHYYLLVFNLKTPKIEILDNSKNGINVSVDDLYGESFKKLKKRFIEYLAYSEQRSWKSMKKAVCERIEMSWKTEYNVIDCGIFMMRHMETFMGYAKNWKCGFKNEGWEHKTQIYDLRKKYLWYIIYHNTGSILRFG
ncbi:ulp1 protease family, C-terminal catalytic domain-containing protein [Tanacetum coccineum]